ncbi:MAG: hypothetical protein RBS68_02070 [Anaerolineales bacterium]|jgi:hypothetical protein|nr:hypothetical protein [Anaerolineales bacterium]
MDDILLNLIVFAALAIVGGLVFVLVRQRQAQSRQEIIQMAAEKGWQIETLREPLRWGERLISPGWRLEATSRASGRELDSGSSDVAMQTVWSADQPGPTLLIGERSSQANLGSLGGMLQQQVLQLALGPDANGLTEIRAGSAAFQQKYMLWAQNPADVRLSTQLESILLEWKGIKPIIKRTSAGLTIELQGAHLKTAPDLLRLVDLGETSLKTL